MLLVCLFDVNQIQAGVGIIINQRKPQKKAKSMIFPQDTAMSSLGYYPYLFSTNLSTDFYNYFPVNYASFPPFIANNIVYPQLQPSSPPLSGKSHPFLPFESANHDILPQKSEALNKGESDETRTIQLCNRNVLPNNVSLILCFIRRIKKSGKLVQKIISSLSSEKQFNSKRFYSYQLFLKENCTDFKWKKGIQVLINYCDPNCSAFSLEQQQFYNRVCRILIASYLEQICRLQVLNHTKINRTHIHDHLKVIRYIRETLRGKFKPQMIIQYQ